MATTTRDRIAERRLARMRQGQSVCSYVNLLSDPEIRVALVPLREAEYMNAISKIASMKIGEGLAAMEVLDRRRAQEILIQAIREPDDLTERVYNSVEELMEDFEVADVDHTFDAYNEMVADSSPHLDGIPEEEFENLKLLLQKMDWSELSGRAWYAASRFLSTITPSPLLDKSSGSSSTKPLITQNDSDESTQDA